VGPGAAAPIAPPEYEPEWMHWAIILLFSVELLLLAIPR